MANVACEHVALKNQVKKMSVRNKAYQRGPSAQRKET